MTGKNEHEHVHVHVRVNKEDAADFELAARRLKNNIGKTYTHEELAKEHGLILDDLVGLDVEFEK